MSEDSESSPADQPSAEVVSEPSEQTAPNAPATDAPASGQPLFPEPTMESVTGSLKPEPPRQPPSGRR
jgi:hypothetical protein